MPHHDTRTITGTITHVFGHRFVVETDDGAVLADLTPKGRDQIAIRSGDDVTLFGEMKPTELKVSRFTRDGKTIEIEHKDKHHGPKHKHHDRDDSDPRREPKHV